MLTLQEGAIAKIDLPPGFVLMEETRGGMAMNWLRRYSKNGNDISISLFYRGAPELAQFASDFRSLLETETVVFDGQNGPSDEVAAGHVKNMRSVLGNAGNNQITNQDKENGPHFFLEKIQTIKLNGRPVLSVQGYFYGGDGEIDNYYMGIFFDATPGDATACKVEEIIFEAKSWELFEKNFGAFQASLNSIRWE